MRLNDAVETFERHAQYEAGATQVEYPQRGCADRTEPQSVWWGLGTTEQEQMSAACNKIIQSADTFCLDIGASGSSRISQTGDANP